jgi:hypothetical protein
MRTSFGLSQAVILGLSALITALTFAAALAILGAPPL